MSSHTYRAVIRVPITDVDGNENFAYYEADVLQPLSENISSEVTTHPLVEGNTLADHMIIQPKTMSLSGAFSLNGSQHTNYDGEYGRLANVQKTFEDILANGTFCSILTLQKNETGYDTNQKVRFLQRDNMVLNSISWSHGLNTLNFTFGFVEALTADVRVLEEGVDYQVDVRDPNLPELTEGQVLDFTENFLDYSKIDEMVIKMCWDCNIITEEFMELLVTIDTVVVEASIVMGVLGAAALLGLALIVKMGALTAAAAIFPVGTIIAGATVICAGMVFLFSYFAREANRKKYKVQQFKKYKSDVENQAEVERFTNFIGQIHQQLEQLENVLKMYSIPVNASQECMLYIDDNYYIFVFERNNTTNAWSLKVVNAEEKVIAQQAVLTGLTSITDCKTSNALFRTEGAGSYVYIMNAKLAQNVMSGVSEETADDVDDLRNYQIFISKINMEEYTDVLRDIIENALEA